MLLVAKTDAAHRALAEQFAGRRVEKVYLALVHGAVPQDEGRIEKPIARDPVRRVRMTARLDRGRTAFTRYRVLRRWPAFTLLEVRIGTGRTHQIRVHLASIGHPVAGDRLYGAPARIEEMPPLGRYSCTRTASASISRRAAKRSRWSRRWRRSWTEWMEKLTQRKTDR